MPKESSHGIDYDQNDHRLVPVAARLSGDPCVSGDLSYRDEGVKPALQSSLSQQFPAYCSHL